ncbi:MAG: hypothetical protein WAP23_02380 [Candidatus Spechtbacterales bacterium]
MSTRREECVAAQDAVLRKIHALNAFRATTSAGRDKMLAARQSLDKEFTDWGQQILEAIVAEEVAQIEAILGDGEPSA